MYKSDIVHTNETRTDGFGAQFQSILWTLLYSQLTGRKFIYTDIPSMDHLITNHGSIRDTEDENSLEDVINFMSIKNYVDTNTSRRSQNHTITIPFRQAYNFIESNIDIVHRSDIFLKFKKHFYENKKSRFNNEFINVAIHIRRMGKNQTEIERERITYINTPNSYYLNIMNLIRNNHRDKNLKFHIYSQGSIDDFRDLNCDEDVVFHLNERVLDTFTDIMFADILVTAASSFSYIAALLSNNASEIHYKSFWHPPLNSWIIH